MNRPDEENVTRVLRELKTGADGPYQGIGPAQARRMAAARRRRNGLAVVAAVVVVAIVTVGAVLGLGRSDGSDRLHPVTPPDATLASSSAAVTSIGRIDWRNAIMNLPANNSTCPYHRVQFTNGSATLAPWHYKIVPSAEPVYGDVNRDGFTDAVVVITCWGNGTTPGGPETQFLIVAFTGNAKGGPTPIGLVDGMQAYVDPTPSLRDGGGTIAVNWKPASGGTLVRSYRWTGAKFVQVS